MTIVIADNSPRKTYTATAGQTDFPTDFAFFAKADVNVYVNGTLKTLDSDFSIPTTGPSAWTSGNDGTVVFTTGLSAGDTVVLTRDVELERTTDFPSSGPFQVATLNTELDKIVAMIADLEDLASRGITLADSDTGTTASLPDVTARKGRVLAFENDATAAPKAGPLITDVQSVADVSADIATLADIQDGTVATNAITTVSSISSDVTTVSSNNANVTTVAGQTTNMQNITDNLTAVQNAATNATNAAASATAAATSETNAATSETNAATSETNAATSATNASNSASAASTSASAASTSATAAASSATAAAASETAAETAETNAETAETNAATSATNAATSATNAANSATSAASSATTATTKASEASTSATNAATSETNAATSATNASSSASAASSSETAAAASETAAATSETNAATSETNAASSATNAATSATNASTSETNAASSATSAASSATSAASAQTAAESARDSALAAYDNFDDRFLGTKTSDPTVDNDGDALVAGTLYFNSTDGAMKIYTGSAWVAAYVSGTSFAALSGATFTGDVTVPNLITSGNVDGRDVSVDGTKLDGIEANATADQTAAEIRTLVESATDSNVFTDADHTKLNGIETSADVTDTTNVVAALTAGTNISIAANGTISSTDTNTTYTANGDYGITLSGTEFRLEDDRRRNSTSVDVYSGNTHDYTFYDADVGVRWYTAGVEEMRLENDGDLHVDGNITAYSTTVSDLRLKKDVRPIKDALKKVQQLNGCTFTYLKDDRKSAGLIAQDIEKVLPSAVIESEAVYHGKEGETYKTVQYDQLIGLLVEAVKELKAEIEELKDASSKQWSDQLK